VGPAEIAKHQDREEPVGGKRSLRAMGRQPIRSLMDAGVSVTIGSDGEINLSCK